MNYKNLLLLFCLSIFLSQGREVNAQTTDTFNYTGTIVQWTVPTCVSQITMTASGAQGGDNFGLIGQNLGGKGAKMSGTFTVTPGTVFKIIVGQRGINATSGNTANGAGGGGGGSFVWIASPVTLLLAAGGGGGSSLTNNGVPYYYGMDAVTTTAATGSRSGVLYNDAVGGTNGGDGTYSSGAGHGWNTVQGNAAGGASCAYGGTGGYGGGGGSGCASCCSNPMHSAGGGGGYSGGGAGGTTYYYGGGGGGSYNIGTNQTNTAGAKTNNGQVYITFSGGGSLTNVAQVISNVSCFGANNGVASANVTGSSTPYTYLWAPSGGTSATASGLSPGIYTITVHDPCGNSASASVTITQPNILTVSASPLGNVSCNGGNNGTASSTVNGGTGPYTYSWTPAGGTNATGVGLSVGTYSLNVKDNHGCTGSATVTITQPAPLSITATTTANIPCYGDNNGTALGSANSGTPPYTYAWSPVGGNLATAVGLAPGIYTVTLTDNNGCTGSARTTVTQPAAALTTSVTTTANVLCNGKNTGSISSSTAGGTLPYTYSWTGGQTSASANALTAGTYTLDITDANGCKVSAAATVSQPTAVKVITDFTVDSGYCTGSAWVMVNGGVLPYTYLWSNGNTTYYIQDICGTNKYCCKITDAQGCSIDSECVIVNNVLGVSNVIAGAGKITVYPNPTSGQFTIQLSAFSSQWSVEVYNVLGEKVYSQANIQNATSNINLGNEPNGVYLYRVISNENGNMVGEGKLVIEK